jgi:hypothetical protein
VCGGRFDHRAALLNSSNTKRIFGLLSQLIALETTASDLAITPPVRVLQ